MRPVTDQRCTTLFNIHDTDHYYATPSSSHTEQYALFQTTGLSALLKLPVVSHLSDWYFVLPVQNLWSSSNSLKEQYSVDHPTFSQNINIIIKLFLLPVYSLLNMSSLNHGNMLKRPCLNFSVVVAAVTYAIELLILLTRISTKAAISEYDN